MTSGGGPRRRFEAQLEATSHAGSWETAAAAPRWAPGGGGLLSFLSPLFRLLWSRLCTWLPLCLSFERPSLEDQTVT